VKRLPGAVRNFTSAIDAVLARDLAVHYDVLVLRFTLKGLNLYALELLLPAPLLWSLSN
jgi:hypothetical protein